MKQQKIKTQALEVLCVSIFFLLSGCENPESDNKIPSLCSADAALADVFTDVQTAATQTKDENVIRRRNVRTNLQELKSRMRNARKQKLRLSLFSDREIEVIADSVESPSERNIILSGRVVGHRHSAVTIVVNNRAVVGHVHLPDLDQHFEIRTAKDGSQTIEEVKNQPEECNPIEAPPVKPGERDDEIVQSDGPPMIDMLVVYTPAARAKMGSTEAMVALIQVGVADTNQAFLNSRVGITARLVGTLELTANETLDMSADLSALRGTTDGKWDEVHAKRTSVGADQVTLVGAYNGTTSAGIGYVSSSRSTAFTILRTSVFRQFTFSHELGHNMGLNHSDGIESAAGGFRTIMSYGTYPRIRHYSNPSVLYNAVPTGTATQNSSAILNANPTRIPNLMTQVVPEPTEPTPNEPPEPTEPQSPAPCLG